MCTQPVLNVFSERGDPAIERGTCLALKAKKTPGFRQEGFRFRTEARCDAYLDGNLSRPRLLPQDVLLPPPRIDASR